MSDEAYLRLRYYSTMRMWKNLDSHYAELQALIAAGQDALRQRGICLGLAIQLAVQINPTADNLQEVREICHERWLESQG